MPGLLMGNAAMSLKKQYLKSKPVCKVTFRIPKDTVSDAHNVCIVGDFNNWSTNNTPMKNLKNGDFTATLELRPGQEYQFRYLIDNRRWENDREADKYIFNNYANCENSVVIV